MFSNHETPREQRQVLKFLAKYNRGGRAIADLALQKKPSGMILEKVWCHPTHLPRLWNVLVELGFKEI